MEKKHSRHPSQTKKFQKKLKKSTIKSKKKLKKINWKKENQIKILLKQERI